MTSTSENTSRSATTPTTKRIRSTNGSSPFSKHWGTSILVRRASRVGPDWSTECCSVPTKTASNPKCREAMTSSTPSTRMQRRFWRPNPGMRISAHGSPKSVITSTLLSRSTIISAICPAILSTGASSPMAVAGDSTEPTTTRRSSSTRSTCRN